MLDSNKMLFRSYFEYSTKIFGKVKKTIQPKTLVDSSKRFWLTKQKLVDFTKMFCEINKIPSTKLFCWMNHFFLSGPLSQ